MNSHYDKYIKTSVIVLFSLSFVWLFSYILRPTEIVLVEGSEQTFNVDKNLNMTLVDDTAEDVLSINNKPIEENIKVDIDNTLTVESNNIGEANITLDAFGIPIKRIKVDVIPDFEVIPSGDAVGVRVDTNGVMVLGTGEVKCDDGSTVNPCEDILKSGDLILAVNGQPVSNKEDLTYKIQGNEEIIFTVNRNGDIIDLEVTPYNSSNGTTKIGLWVRDSTQGIGTITYYNPSTNKYGALGHGIVDIDTKTLMNIKDGKVMDATVIDVVEGEKGNPGELVGDINTEEIFANVLVNTEYGIFGYWDETKIDDMPNETYPIGLQEEIHEGPAVIKSDINNEGVAEYDIYIEDVNKYTTDDSKGMVIKITDPKLLAKTNGIVQGMSGSPIIQDGKLVGAVTHVFVQDPTKGYGVFIDNMIKQEQLI